MGIMTAGQQAAMGKYLAFSRTQEATADAAGGGLPAQGAGSAARACSISSGSCEKQEYRLVEQLCRHRSLRPDPPAVGRSHRRRSSRATRLDPAWNSQDRSGARRALPARQGQADRLCRGSRADAHRISGERPERRRRIMRGPMPGIARLIPTRPLPRSTALVATAPHDPYFLELKGQILLESGKPKEALAVAARGGRSARPISR